MAEQLIFVSSSGDLGAARQAIHDDLKEWLRGYGIDDLMAPYLWEDDLEASMMLTDRVPIQEALPDPAYTSVGLTLCLFGERCGLPLHAELPPHWEERIKPWKVSENEAGLVHPWPTDRESQIKALENGGFPLTGTVFELISAFSSGDKGDGLIIGYVASRPVELETTLSEIDFNDRQLWSRLTKGCKGDDERDRVDEQIYWPQVRALLNLLKYLSLKFGARSCFGTVQELQENVLGRAKAFLRERFGFTSLENPFKATLEHWDLDEPRDLPGRARHLREIPEKIRAHPELFTLLKGRSGCGKSSLMQRGVLARLRKEERLVLAVRPAEIEPRITGEDHLEVLFDLLTDAAQCPMTRKERAAIRAPNRPRQFARHFVDALERRNRKFVLGLDQFEEVLDELQQFDTARGRSRGWWLVMRFLSEVTRSARFTLVGTLESSRAKTFETLDIEKEIGLHRQVIDVDVNADDVAEIAETGFRRAGIRLEPKLVEEIKSRWEEFEADNDPRRSASPLPLACLWLAQLFDRFEDKARVHDGKGVEGAARQAFGNEVTLSFEELGGQVSFGDTIARLADAAWLAAENNPLSIERLKSAASLNSLDNFLNPLVAVDGDGHKRLLSVREKGNDDLTSRLRHSFRQLRLLVPASERDPLRGLQRFRLAHQAVIDHWPPGRYWFELREPLMAAINELTLDAQRWARNPGSQVHKGRHSIRAAAAVLNERSSEWNSGDCAGLDPEDDILRRYAIEVFHHSRTPNASVEGSAFSKRYVHLAAQYHFMDLLRDWTAKDKKCLSVTNAVGNAALMSAAWTDGPAVPFILEVAGVPAACKGVWHPIEASIQMHAMENYRHISAHLDPETPIGPDGRTMLWSAASYGNLAVLEEMLARGANPNVLAAHELTALHAAASNEEVAAFKRLLAHCDPGSGDKTGRTPVGSAAARGAIGILQAFLDSDEIAHEAVDRILRKQDESGFTPLMLAARLRHPECLRLLLESCDPRDIDHRDARGRTILHLTVMDDPWSKPSDEEKVRARRAAEVVLEDGRIDPCHEDEEGRTAFELGKVYADARRVIRRHMPTDYDMMSAAMRVEDLESRDNGVVLRLIRSAPQVLTDLHDDTAAAEAPLPSKRDKRPRSGFDILLDAKNIPVLTTLLAEGIVDDGLLVAVMPRLLELATSSRAVPLRQALLRRLVALPATDKVVEAALPQLFDRFLRDEDEAALGQFSGLGITAVCGPLPLRASVFHDLAQVGETARFEALAQRRRLALPLDEWGRRPSDIAADRLVKLFRTLEDRHFDPPLAVAFAPLGETRFHELARAGDLRGFERQARGAQVPLPRDGEGRIPSDVAPEEFRDVFAALEKTHFPRSN